jgi:antitoxin VapB
MPLSIRDERTDQLVRELAARRKIGLTEAVRLAVENELRRGERTTPLRERLRPIQDRIAARPATGLEADKAFYDDLGGDA